MSLRCLALLIALTASGFIARSLLAGTNDPSMAILYPADGSVLKTPVVLIMAIAPAAGAQPSLTLDGKPLGPERMTFAPQWAFHDARLSASTRPVESQSPGAHLLKDKSGKVLLLAAVKLAPGQHEIAVGQSRITVFCSQTADQSDAPKDALVFHPHQPPKDAAEALACDRCHTVTNSDGQRTLGLAKVPASCESCHDEVNVQLAHRHVLDSLAKCATCHDPHGSTRARILTAPQEKLCTTCHEAGHSKR